ncbi:MAG: 3-phosphoshikimate 1-carboxyvinyltransferase, partial [Hyphomicrobiaceae bacterium]
MPHDHKPRPLVSHKSGSLSGRIRVPGDKSISHRALMLGAISTGRTRIKGLLEAEDVINTARALTALGAPATRTGDTWEVLGRGVGGLSEPHDPLDFGNSGTGTRLMMGVIAGQPITVKMTGDASLSRRPMGRVLGPLKQMGLQVLDGDKDTLPLTIRGSSELVPIEYELPVASAQLKSAILLAGLSAAGETTVISEKTRDHT